MRTVDLMCELERLIVVTTSEMCFARSKGVPKLAPPLRASYVLHRNVVDRDVSRPSSGTVAALRGGAS
jgi:hypothetical protein